MNGAKYVCDSGNAKITGSQRVDATYVSISATCPPSCPLKSNGCYAQVGPVGIHVSRIDKEAENLSPLQVARAEANAIDSCYDGGKVPKGRCLRLHVSGDSRTIAGSKIVNNAIGRWKNRGGGIVWGYTHCWDSILREHWSNVEMLASVDSVEEAEFAKQNGYAPAIVVAEHLDKRAYMLPGSDIKWIPCPAQTYKVGCSDCCLCFNTDRLYSNNMGIAFSAHGVKKNSIKKRLNIIK